MPDSHIQPHGGIRPTVSTNAVVYLTHGFPIRTETFIYREVQALRRRGHRILTVGLNAPEPTADPVLIKMEAATLVLCRSRLRALTTAIVEALTHPLRGLATIATAIRDALAPGESLAPTGRLKVLNQAVAGLALARVLRPLGVGHIHCHFANAPATVGMYAAAQLGVPFSFTGHAIDLFTRRTLLRRKLSRAAFVACVSDWHREFYRSLVPEGTPRYHIVRCGIDPETWTSEPRPRAFPDGMLRVPTVCRLVEKKGVDTLIRALSDLRGRAATLTIAGDGPLRQPLGDLADRLGCDDAIEWLGQWTMARFAV